MNREGIDDRLLANIQMPEDLKKDLFENCKKGKRSADFRFRHSGVLMALLVVLVVGTAGIGAKAAYETVARRLESMTAPEKENYSLELKNDTSVVVADGFSRNLTDGECLRLAKLERSYYDNNEFPQEAAKHLATLKEWDGNCVAYVEEDGLLHFPVEEMTDEQLLQFIDHQAKADYVMNESDALTEEVAAEALETAGSDIGDLNEEDAVSQGLVQDEDGVWVPEELIDHDPEVELDEATQKEAIEVAKQYLKQYLGVTLDDGWTAFAYGFQYSKYEGSPEKNDVINVDFQQGDYVSMYGTGYGVTLGFYDNSLRGYTITGAENYVKQKAYDLSEAEKMAEEEETYVKKVLSERFGCKEPDQVKTKILKDEDDSSKARQVLYMFKGKTENVTIIWDLSDRKIASYNRYYN